VWVGQSAAGLRQAFHLAGAKAAVVASLWSVPDRPTTQLMQMFFRSLVAGQSMGRALNGSELALLKNFREKEGVTIRTSGADSP